MKRALPFFLILAVVFWISQRPSASSGETSSSNSAWRLPVLGALEMKGFKGEVLRITPGDGQVWVLSVGAAWIKDSVASYEMLEGILKERPALRVVGVLSDSRREDSAAFAAALKVTYPLVWASDDYVATFGLPSSLPRWMVLGRDGRPAASLLPGAPRAELLSALDKVLALPPAVQK